MALISIKVDREGIAGEATYGKMYINIPKESYSVIKNRKIMLNQSQVAKFQKYKTSLGVGNVTINNDSRIMNYCKENSDGSAIFTCYTLEDLPRKVKIKKSTCIPTGTYVVTLVNSPKFGRGCPAINNVPNFDGIRIHAGTSHSWTDGCVLVGFERTSKNTRLSSAASAEAVLWTLLANLVNVGNSLNIVIKFTFKTELKDEVVSTPTETNVQEAISYMNSGFIGATNKNNYTSVGPAGDCGCYSLSQFDPDEKGDYAKQNVKKFLTKIADHVYDTVKNRVDIKSFTNGVASTGTTNVSIVQDKTNYKWVVPTKDNLELLLETYTNGRELNIKSSAEKTGTVVFDSSFKRTMEFEGEYIYDPLDTAFERNYGLTFKFDSEILEKYKVKNIKSITKKIARLIYKEKYWDAYNLGDLIEQDTADLLFDTLVCCGLNYGEKIIKKTIKENYGVSAPNETTTWKQYIDIIKYVGGPKFIGEILENRVVYHKSFVASNPQSVRYFDSWIDRCDSYRVEIANDNEDSNSNAKYFENVFGAIDEWLKNGKAESTEIYNGVYLTYNNSGMIMSYIPPTPKVIPNFVGIKEWGKICQMRIDAKTDWTIDIDSFQSAQWNIVSECLEKAFNTNIITPIPSSGSSSYGLFSGNISSFLVWSV